MAYLFRKGGIGPFGVVLRRICLGGLYGSLYRLLVFGTRVALNVETQIMRRIVVGIVVRQELLPMETQRVDIRLVPLALSGSESLDITQVGCHAHGCVVPALHICRRHYQRPVHQRSGPHRCKWCLGLILCRGGGLHLVGSEIYVRREGHRNLHDIALLPFARGDCHV